MAKIVIHEELGLSDDEMRVIDEELRELILVVGSVSGAARKIAATYDVKAVMVGMRFMQLIRINDDAGEVRGGRLKVEEKTEARKTLTRPPDPNLN